MVTLKAEIFDFVKERAEQQGLNAQDLIRIIVGDWFQKEKITWRSH
jgi:hypothetical protein